MGLSALTNIAKATIISETKSLVTKNKHSFTRQARKLGQPQRWRIKLSTAPLPYQQAMGVYAQLASLDGVYGKDSLPCPLPQIGSALSVKNRVARAIGASSVDAIVLAKEAGDAIGIGDFIQFAGHKKVYQVTLFNSESGEVQFYPKLKSAVGASEQIKVGKDVEFYIYSQDSDTEISITAARPVPVNIELVEVTQ